MDLYSSNPYWLMKNGIPNHYPSLQQNETCDVVIIGTGISGAFAAWNLNRAGINTLLVDKRYVGLGSTVASTSLLQYEIDIPLIDLIKKVGEKNAINSYKLCLKAIDTIAEICTITNNLGDFIPRQSLQYASFKSHVAHLKAEFTCRQQYGLPVEWLIDKDVQDRFGFTKPAAIISNAGAEVNAYRLAHSMLQYCIKHYQTKVYERTKVVNIKRNKSKFQLTTENGCIIDCKNVVIACGYESQYYLPKKIENLYSTYAIVSEPFIQQDFWEKNALIWETAIPYLYMRTTTDNRILIGGKDSPYTNAAERDKQLKQKSAALQKSFVALFPHINFKTAFSWAGTFSGSKDGLPFIGEYPGEQGIYFALGFGGNGITFSVIAGEIICNMILGKKNAYSHIFKFDR